MVNDYSCLLYWCLLMFTVGSQVVWDIVILICRYITHTTLISNELVSLYFYAASTIMISVIPGQIARYNVIATKDNIIATKQAYVRYISHELRTPIGNS